MREVVVLGAGPTGLGTALGVALNGNESNVWILEKKGTPGGLSGSFVWKEHSIDFGPHRLSPNLLSVRVLAEELLGPDCLVNKSQHGVQLGGRLYQFPPRVQDWIAPAAFWELICFVTSYLAGKARWLVRRFRPDDFESTAIAKFGRRFYDRILAPMCEKVWSAPVEIDPSFVNQRFVSIQPSEVLKKVIFPRQELNPARFYYPRRGFQQLWNNLSAYLEREGQSVLYRAQPTRLEVRKNRIMRVHYEHEGAARVLEGEALELVSTIPLLRLLEILEGLETETLLEKARRIRFKSMFLVAFEIEQARSLPFRTLIFPEKRFCFNRLFEQNEYSRDTVATGRSVLVADLTFPRGGEEGAQTDEEVIARVRRDLESLPYFPADRVRDTHVERVEYAYVIPDVQSRKLFHEIQHELKKVRNLYLVGRFAAGEYDNSDYAVDTGLALGATLAGRASRLEYLFAQHAKRGRSIVG